MQLLHKNQNGIVVRPQRARKYVYFEKNAQKKIHKWNEKINQNEKAIGRTENKIGRWTLPRQKKHQHPHKHHKKRTMRSSKERK